MVLVLIGYYLCLCVAVGWVAGQQNRNKFEHFMGAVFFSPLIWLLVLIAVPPLKKRTPEEVKNLVQGVSATEADGWA